MRGIKTGLLSIALLLIIGQAGGALAYVISINQFVEHTSLDEAVLGFKEQLAEMGLEVTYLEHNAQGSMSTVLQIAHQMKDERPDLILAVSTPSAQTTAQNISDIPILFTAVTDPVSAGLVKTMDKPGANVTGTTDMNPILEQVALIREIQPHASKLGVIFNPGETNSVVQVEILREAAKKHGFEIIEAPAPNPAAILQAAQSLVGQVEAIFLPTDNSVIAGMDTIVNIALDQRIPIYPSENNSVRKGGVATLSINYYELGRLTGRMAARLLKGEAIPSETPVEALKKLALVVNERFATAISLVVAPSVMERAQIVFK
ncbi:MAG: ABC transporter substrate-binding protein [Deltaproteobacteria bacterium]|jgi:putative ABC transport system substrate-binding protein|nr:ABC transporter substrate-binding protein [Deltaproteobacteria bacterium]